jgi:hypothetical protein
MTAMRAVGEGIDLRTFMIQTISLNVHGGMFCTSQRWLAVFDTQSVFDASDAHKPVVLTQCTLAMIGNYIRMSDRHDPSRSQQTPI